MAWIEIIDYPEADGKLKKIYDRVKGPDDNVDNILLIHSLRPHSLVGHMALYKNVLHNSNNTLEKWFLEALGVYVSYLNQCDYCYEHHFVGFSRLIDNAEKSKLFKACVEEDKLYDFFKGKELQAMRYAKKLTLDHFNIDESDVSCLRDLGFSDGEILEINQVVSYFNYVNRTVVGLGVDAVGDILGLSPNNSADAENWSHS